MSQLQLGPIVTVSKSCNGCTAKRSESYAVQGDSGHDVYCTHPAVGKKHVGDTCWTTPGWCPVEAAGQGEVTDEMIDAACAAVKGLYRVDALNALEAALATEGPK